MFKKFFLFGLISTLIISNFACNSTTSENLIKREIEMPPVGWQVFQGEKFAIALPEKFVGGDPNQELKKITEVLTNLDCVSNKTKENLEQNAKVISLIAFLPQCEQGHLVTVVNIISNKVKADTTFEEYLEAQINKLKTKAEIKQQEIIKNKPLSIGKIISEITEENLTMKQVFYIISKDQNYWIITYTTPAHKFEEYLPIFEASFKSFQLF